MTAFAPGRTTKLFCFIRRNPRHRRSFCSSGRRRQSHYETLGVPRTATHGQIKTSFYRLSQQYHPDINKDPGAREKFQKASTAWAVLKDGREKREYDKLLRQEEAATGHSSDAYYDQSTDWSSHSRRPSRQSAEWAWSFNSRMSSSGNSAFRRSHKTNNPFLNPHVQRATGKAHPQDSTSSADPWHSESGYYGPSGRGKRKSAASSRAEEMHAREAEANSQAGMWNTFPTIGVTLIFLLLAHGWGAKA